MTAPTNTIVLCADQLHPRALGYAGSGWMRTPALDALADRGTVFTDAVCTSPICVPSRASLATGRYVHQLGTWDNGHPYAGQAPSWGHRLTRAGRRVVTIGKLHFAGTQADTGYPEQILPMHAEDGVGDLYSMLRDDLPRRPELRDMVAGAAVGHSDYTRYDQAVTAAACKWLGAEALDATSPWTLFVSFVSPHHPLVAPPEFAALYPPDLPPLPVQWSERDRPRHPVLERLRGYYGYDSPLTEAEVRRARAVYFGLVSYLDHQVGQVLDRLDAVGLADRTRVIFTADHGDNIGEHGMWWKNCMFQGAVGVPLIVAGPGVPDSRRCATPVSHVDLYRTICDSSGVPVDDPGRPGTSLFDILESPEDPERRVFAEYHAAGSRSGMFMVADARYKYIEYVDDPPQLFDRRNDPDEVDDLAGNAGYADVLDRYAARLREICDPVTIDRQAKASQAGKVARFGGPDAVRAAGFRTHVPVPDDLAPGSS